MTKYPGFEKQDRKKMGEYVKQMASICGKDVLPEVKIRKKRKGGKRGSYDNPEARLRNDIIKILRKRGFWVKRVEPSFRGKFGLGDLWVFSVKYKWGGWIEVKTPQGVLSDAQKEVRDLCSICGVNYVVMRHKKEAKNFLLDT